MATPPESSTVASSTHAIGEAAPLPAVVIDGATRSLRLGGAGAAFLCPGARRQDTANHRRPFFLAVDDVVAVTVDVDVGVVEVDVDPVRELDA
ncbi:MAG: hypothetical protein AUJ01_01660 [Acidobacteria bacterium 13_1_40CM_3_65_5]|nr:MAG: hypothetical protein AUJ01_01660 [Acidobacteria bacterium 13_1_40CM_3_65_5]